MIENNALREIFYKTLSEDVRVQVALVESSISTMLVEEFSQRDIDVVRKEVNKVRKNLKALSDYVASVIRDTGKISGITAYMDALEDALKVADNTLTKVAFDAHGGGMLSRFMGQKLTIPQTTQAAITLYTKTKDFNDGLLKAMTLIENNLVPLVTKGEDKNKPLEDLLDTDGYPKLGVVSNSLTKGFKKVFSTSAFGKIKALFSKAISSVERKALAKLPTISPAVLASQLTDGILSSSVDDITNGVPPKLPETSDELQQAAADSQDAEEAASDDSAGTPPVATGDVGEELQSAVQDAVKSDETPVDAMTDAIDDWISGLSKTSKKTIAAKNRDEKLKDAIQSATSDVTEILAKSISDSIAAWRADHEETLIKSKRFSKKNFDSLNDLIPRLAKQLMKQTNESSSTLTPAHIDRHVRKILNKLIDNNGNVIAESSRWVTLAGIN